MYTCNGHVHYNVYTCVCVCMCWKRRAIIRWINISVPPYAPLSKGREHTSCTYIFTCSSTTAQLTDSWRESQVQEVSVMNNNHANYITIIIINPTGYSSQALTISREIMALKVTLLQVNTFLSSRQAVICIKRSQKKCKAWISVWKVIEEWGREASWSLFKDKQKSWECEKRMSKKESPHHDFMTLWRNKSCQWQWFVLHN